MDVRLTFWNALDCLQKLQMKQYESVFASSKTISNDLILSDNMRNHCIKAIEDIVEGITENVIQGKAPVLRIPKTVVCNNSSRSSEDFVSAGNAKSLRRFVFLIDVLSKSYVLLKNNSFATRRDLFYENVALYEKQQNTDKALEDAARMLNVPRRSLHVTATGKGLIAGNLTYVTYDGVRVQVDQALQGMIVSGCVGGITDLHSDARFILVIEKDATFQKLLEAHFLRTMGPSILITGKGYPDLCTRQLLHRLWVDLRLPVLALVDADPFGIHIAAVYKFGAIARTEPNLCVNGLALLGILPSELTSLQLPPKALMPLAPCDHGKLAALEAHPAIKNEISWLHQIKCLRNSGYKTEIQSLTHISPDFLTTAYLPTKIKSGHWIL